MTVPSQTPTVDGWNLANHLRCVKPCKYWDKLPTYRLAGFLPSTVLHLKLQSLCCTFHPLRLCSRIATRTSWQQHAPEAPYTKQTSTSEAFHTNTFHTNCLSYKELPNNFTPDLFTPQFLFYTRNLCTKRTFNRIGLTSNTPFWHQETLFPNRAGPILTSTLYQQSPRKFHLLIGSFVRSTTKTAILTCQHCGGRLSLHLWRVPGVFFLNIGMEKR